MQNKNTLPSKKTQKAENYCGHSYQFGWIVDRIVNLCTYGVILSIVWYMISRILRSFALIFSAIFSGGNTGDSTNLGDVFVAPDGVIHAVPITIILVKAYKLLLEYAKTQHVNIKYVLEIAITAPVVEIIFNFTGYDHIQLIFMGGFTVIMSLIYLYFYETIKKVEVDYAVEHTKNTQE